MAKAEREDLHSLEEEEHILLLMMADNVVGENGMNWKNVHCELKEHGPFVVAAVGHRLHLRRMHGDD